MQTLLLEQLIDPMLKVFLLIAKRLMQSISVLSFLCRVEQPSVFNTLLVLMLPRHFVQALCITRYNYLCQFSHSNSVDLTLANEHEDGSTILRLEVPNFTPSILGIPRLLPTLSETYSAG